MKVAMWDRMSNSFSVHVCCMEHYDYDYYCHCAHRLY